MKNSLRYSKLWQQKRDELKVNANADQDWGDMSNLLDQHLPVSPKGSTSGGGSGSASGLSNFGGLAGIAGISVAVIAVTVYLAVHFSGDKSEKPRRDSSDAKQHTQIITRQDSLDKLQDSAINYSQAVKDSGSVNEDSKSPAGSNSDVVSGNAAKSNNTTPNSAASNARSTNGMTNSSAGNVGAKTNPAGALSGKSSSGVNTSGRNNNPIGLNSPSVNNGLSNAGKNGSGVFSKSGRGTSLSNNGKRLAGNSGNNPLNGGNGRYGVGYNANGKFGGFRQRGGNGSRYQNQVNTIISSRDAKGKLQSNSGKDDLNSVGVYHSRDTINTNAYDPFLPFKQAALLNGQFDNRDIISASVVPFTKNKPADDLKNGKNKKDKKTKASSAGDSKFDYGILGGVNLSNSTGLYGGAYGAYHISDKWGVNLQVTGLTSQNISGGYSHANGSKVDSGKIIQVTDSRKAYFVSVPLHATYNITDNFSVKAGPVLNIPVKQTNGVTSLTPTTINRDSAYYSKTINQLNNTRYNQQINFGVSGGVRYQYNRFSIEATYLKNLSSFSVTSDYGTYKTNGSGMLNITLGIQLNKRK